MMHAFAILTIGVVSGFCSSTPPGPINMWLVDQTLASRKMSALPFLGGVIFSDILFALLAVWGYAKILHQEAMQSWVSQIAGIFLIIIGFYGIFQLRRHKDSTSPSSEPVKESVTPLKGFSIGMAMCGSNPAFLLFWVFVIDQCRRHLQIEFDGIYSVALCLGIIIGDTIWFKSLIYLVKQGKKKLSELIIYRVRMGIALVFIFSGFLAFAQNN